MKATKVATSNEFDEFFSLNMLFEEETPAFSIMICRDASEDYEAIIYTESLGELFCIYTHSGELSYNLMDEQLVFIFSLDCPHCFYVNNAKLQIIELNANDVPRVRSILEDIFATGC